MNPILIAGGILLGARLISFIFGDLTEKEKNKEEEIRNNVNKYNEREEKFKKAEAENADEIEKKLRANAKNKCRYLIEEVEKRIQEEYELYEDIKNTIIKIKDILKNDQITTALRRNSLYSLLNQLREAKERCYGYTSYLSRYKKYAEKCLDSGKGIEVFLMQIPTQYPYRGKVLRLDVDSLKHNVIIEDPSIDGIPINYKLCDEENIDMLSDGMCLPFMVQDFNREKHCYDVSLDKGKFYIEALTNTHAGVTASVKEIRKNGLVLKYGSALPLFLKNEKLLRPNRKPPVHSEVMVYPVDWEYGLPVYTEDNCPVNVSEREEDAASNLSFSCFPLMMTSEQWEGLSEYLNDNEIWKIDDEWKIGPMDESHINIQDGVRLKLQFGNCLLLEAQLKSYSRNGESTVYFADYIKMMPLAEGFKSDDIFVNIDADLTPVLLSDENYRENIKNHISENELEMFIMDVFSELHTQKKIKNSLSGSRFYQTWSEVIRKLIAYMKKGQQFSVQIDEFIKNDKNLIIKVRNPENLKKQVENFELEYNAHGNKKKGQVSYIFFDKSERQYGAIISSDCSTVTVYGCDHHLVKGDKITLYAENFPYAEIQQIMAMSQFRIGTLMNPKLQSALMDGKNIESSISTKMADIELINTKIASNESQFEALKKAFCEKNIFFIQGPPGTGKTTVIRELVEQYIKRDSDCRILIVSQANVAVDNALSGIVKKHSDMIVRCGNADKIDKDLQSVTLDKYYTDYIERIKGNADADNDEIYNKWIEFVMPDNGMNPNVSELIIRTHKIVGATCVGLAKKRIGIERVNFDLVIIDEAGKALPGEMLIPVLRAKKLIMIGDHHQLPPVINPVLYDPESIELSNREYIENNLFQISLFERLFEQAPESNKTMLTRQFRMPSIIGELVSKLFYDGKLQNGEGTELKNPIYSESNLVMYDFSDDKYYHEEKLNNSIVNYREADYVIELLEKITKSNPGHGIAVITPYRGQKRHIQNCRLKSKILRDTDIRINTIDAFQGDEAEIVIYCSTRAKRKTKYFSDYKRINVALSRAKNELIILGSYKYFTQYSKEQSVLPEVAEFIDKHGIRKKVKADKYWEKSNISNEQIVSVNDILCETLTDIDEYLVNEHINYFYNNGRMKESIWVEPHKEKFKVVNNAEIYCAYIRLNLNECWVDIH